MMLCWEVCTAVAGMSDWGCRPQGRWEAPGMHPASPSASVPSYVYAAVSPRPGQVPAAAGGGEQCPSRAACASALWLPVLQADAEVRRPDLWLKPVFRVGEHFKCSQGL